MRSLTTLAATILLASLPSLAHADTLRTVILNYAGSVVVNGLSERVNGNNSVDTYYDNVSVAATVTVREDIYQYFGTVFYLEDFTVALPDGLFDDTDFTNPILGQNCGNEGCICYQCIRIDFDQDGYASNVSLPTPDLLIDGNRNTFVQIFGPDDYLSDAEDFSGEVSLVTTPEPSTFALLGTGLLGAGGVFWRRRV